MDTGLIQGRTLVGRPDFGRIPFILPEEESFIKNCDFIITGGFQLIGGPSG
jgi:hypothetical protein